MPAKDPVSITFVIDHSWVMCRHTSVVLMEAEMEKWSSTDENLCRHMNVFLKFSFFWIALLLEFSQFFTHIRGVEEIVFDHMFQFWLNRTMCLLRQFCYFASYFRKRPSASLTLSILGYVLWRYLSFCTIVCTLRWKSSRYGTARNTEMVTKFGSLKFSC